MNASRKSLLFTAALITAVLIAPVLAQEHKDIESAKAKYLQDYPVSGQVARMHYLHELIKMHDKLMLIGKGPQWTDAVDARFRAINNEIKQCPAPVDSDSKALSKLRVGNWRSPRHDYIYLSDGTWRMAPASGTTSGHWRIEGNQYWEGETAYTIILLDQHDFVFTDGNTVFYEKRMSQ
jgi:hypothetical protein